MQFDIFPVESAVNGAAGVAAARGRVAGEEHRPFWHSCGAGGRHWAAAPLLVAAAVKKLPGCLSRGRRRTSWRNCCHVAAAGRCLCRGHCSAQGLSGCLSCRWARLAFSWIGWAVHRDLMGSCSAWSPPRRIGWPSLWQAKRKNLPGCCSPGKRSTKSPLVLFFVEGAIDRSSWGAAAHGDAAAFLFAGATHRACRRSCGARGLCWAAAAFVVASAVNEQKCQPFPCLFLHPFLCFLFPLPWCWRHFGGSMRYNDVIG